MKAQKKFEIFLSAPPGLELALKAEALERGFAKAKAVPGGVTFRGNWHDVWRANLRLRGASRVLARIGQFRAAHLAQLDAAARAFDWGAVLRADRSIKVEVSCKASRIYHERAAAERVERALSEVFGGTVTAPADQLVRLRIERDICTLSVDTSGDLLHKRGHKEAVSKAPLRETMAALLLRQCGFRGTEPVLDPMCGSGTFVIEAAEIAMGLDPGRSRSFAFEHLASFDAARFSELRTENKTLKTDLCFRGSDRDAGAIRAAEANAQRAGVALQTAFDCCSISALSRPDGPCGLIMINPPYGGRIGDTRQLFGLYGALGNVLKSQFVGWRVGLVTTDAGLAKATALPFGEPGPLIPHGGLKIRLWQTAALTI